MNMQIIENKKKVYAENVETKINKKRILEGVLFLLQKFAFWKRAKKESGDIEKIKNKINNL